MDFKGLTCYRKLFYVQMHLLKIYLHFLNSSLLMKEEVKKFQPKKVINHQESPK